MQHYNSNYRNDTYTAVKQALQPLVDEQTRIRLMNHVTDAALDICGYSPCAGAVVTLADELIAELRDTDLPSVISPIEAHLKHFLHPQRNHSQQRLIAHFLLRLRLQSLDRELHLTVINAADLYQIRKKNRHLSETRPPMKMGGRMDNVWMILKPDTLISEHSLQGIQG
jgi:hypothetical protein